MNSASHNHLISTFDQVKKCGRRIFDLIFRKEHQIIVYVKIFIESVDRRLKLEPIKIS